MARIVIKDLEENVDLDRAAMRQITGGRSRQRLSGIPTFQSDLFQKPALFEHLNPGGLDFDLNRR